MIKSCQNGGQKIQRNELKTKNHYDMNLKEINVKDLKIGNTLINLGEVLEIEDHPSYYSIVILRNNEKQVHKFFIGQKVVICP